MSTPDDIRTPTTTDPALRFAAHVRARAAHDEKLRSRQYGTEVRDRNRLLLWCAGIAALALAFVVVYVFA